MFGTLVGRWSRNDARLVGRDSFLAWMLIYPVVTALLLRFAAPLLAATLAGSVDIEQYYALAVSYINILTTPMLTGLVFGFLLIDERDEGTIRALLVTPVPLTGYLLYRVAAPWLLSVGLTMVVVPLTSLVTLEWLPLLLTALVVSLYAPMLALFLAAFAENKVQGFVLLKIVGAYGMIPVAAYFLPTPWQDLAGLVFPLFWAIKAFWLIVAGDPFFAVYLGIGLVVQLALLALLVVQVRRMAYRAS